MKKFLLSILVSFTSLVGIAQTYTEEISVSVNGNASPVTTNTIQVTKNADGTCDFLLRNFILKSEDPVFGDMSNPVGNINLKGVKMEAKDGYTEISTEQTIQIEAGDDTSVPAEGWMGPQLPKVPIVLTGKMTDDHLFANISIDLTMMKIDVTIGKDVVSGVEQITVNRTDVPVYNMNGVQVADKFNKNLPQGIYVVGGKKILVK